MYCAPSSKGVYVLSTVPYSAKVVLQNLKNKSRDFNDKKRANYKYRLEIHILFKDVKYFEFSIENSCITVSIYGNLVQLFNFPRGQKIVAVSSRKRESFSRLTQILKRFVSSLSN